jgi:hypothetical protein
MIGDEFLYVGAAIVDAASNADIWTAFAALALKRADRTTPIIGALADGE